LNFVDRQVSARIIQSSHPANVVVPAAARKKNSSGPIVRCRNQIARRINASVRHAEAFMDHRMVIQLIKSAESDLVPVGRGSETGDLVKP
jgi:hypothetical protein